MSNLSQIFNLKDKIKADLEIMRNCLKAEQRRLDQIKISIVKVQQYEQAAKIHDIEKKLTAVINEVENYLS